jgi:hypothetical protein
MGYLATSGRPCEPTGCGRDQDDQISAYINLLGFNLIRRFKSVYKKTTSLLDGNKMRFLFLVFVLLLNISFAHAQERQWRLDVSVEDAFLVFGVPDTDDAGFSFWCKIGSGTVSIFAPFDRSLIKRDQTVPVELVIGDQVFKIKMKATLDINSKTGSIEGPVSVDGTVMKAVASGISISLSTLGHKASYPLIDADVAGLLRTCSGEILN